MCSRQEWTGGWNRDCSRPDGLRRNDGLTKRLELLQGADMYVTLEPCCHHGRTGPCTEAIIAAGIARVFVGVIDPNPVVHGNGLQALQAAGVETAVGVLGASAHQVRPIYSIHPGQTAVGHLKAGITLDGCIATSSGDSKWITVKQRTDAHALRAHCDAVLVGSETVALDRPRLTVRRVSGTDPIRVVLDSQARTSADASVLGKTQSCFTDKRPRRANQGDQRHGDRSR